ncbi:putative cation transport ATPase [Rubrivivax benzoatilyticus JA2 = ATCC BAA-35]|uniref:hypothetical protein n=1 Tax=Rubrivivax benzoatilyticus TaxID=316997 RepID=UPI00020A49A6|nr:hypothetical protein [Rubrivivax benzoatilyticus]EGJ10616.1 putative cation transport ATPase [Rubrivivax benzoatilyticus JA2 = ATCC BAA-35]
MSPGRWIAALEPAHACAGRVRWRYRVERGGALDTRSLRRAAEALRGVREVRVNAAVRSLALSYDPALTDAATLASQLLALPPPAARRPPAAPPSRRWAACWPPGPRCCSGRRCRCRCAAR